MKEQELLFDGHSDSNDRRLLLLVPVKPKNGADKAKIYRLQQFFHMLRNYSMILETGGDKSE